MFDQDAGVTNRYHVFQVGLHVLQVGLHVLQVALQVTQSHLSRKDDLANKLKYILCDTCICKWLCHLQEHLQVLTRKLPKSNRQVRNTDTSASVIALSRIA